MKKTLIALATVVALLLGAYLYMGTRVEPALQELFKQAAETNPNIAFTLKSKDAGLFRSRYAYSMSLPLGASQSNPGAPMTIVMDLFYDVAHGPVPLAAGVYSPSLAVLDATFAIDPKSSKEIREFFDLIPELASSKARARLGFDSSIGMDMTIPAFSKTFPGARGSHTTVGFKGLTGTMRATTAFETYTGQFAAPGLAINDNDVALTLESMTLSMNAVRLRPNLWGGTHQMRAQSLTVIPRGAERFSMQNLTGDVALTPRSNLLDYLIALSGTYAAPHGQTIPLAMNIGWRNLDIDALSELIAVINKPEALGGDYARIEPQLRSLGSVMVSRSPSMEFGVRAYEGERLLSLSCDIRAEGMNTLPQTMAQATALLKGKAEFSGRQQDLTDVTCALAASARNADLTKAKCADDLTALIDQMAALGYVTRIGEKLSSKASWDGRELTVNGKPLK